MRRRSQAGVTLMELLIAVTLLSLVSVGMLFALRIGFSTYGKAQTHLMDNRRVAGAQRVLESELEGMIPVEVPCGGETFQKTPFFQGEPQTMRLVSTFSLQEGWRGRPQILEIFIIPGDSGGVRLVVNEIPFVHPMQAGRLCTAPGRYLPVSPSDKSFVLADKLAICKFSYLQQPENILEFPIWIQTLTIKNWPKAVRIEMSPMEADFSRLQPITVTAPLRIQRTPEMPYVDQ